MINAEHIKEFYRGMGTAPVQCCAAALGISPESARQKILHLQRKGWLERVEGLPDFFRFVDARNGDVSPDGLQEKLWRAARIAKNFTAWDLAMYAGVSLEYARGYAAWLVSKGLLEKAGSAKGNQRQAFRCIENPPMQTPRWRVKTAEKDFGWMEALDGAWALARAILERDLPAARAALVKIEQLLAAQESGVGNRASGS